MMRFLAMPTLLFPVLALGMTASAACASNIASAAAASADAQISSDPLEFASLDNEQSPNNDLESAATTAQSFAFKWRTESDNSILLSIETDLPDNAEVRITVYRTYRATSEDRTDTYSVEYFSAEGQISEWREFQKVDIDDKAWANELLAHQDEMAALPRLAFEIDNVDPYVLAAAYVYGHKKGERFGAREFESTLDQVASIELVASSEIMLRRPLKNADLLARSPESFADDAESLEGSTVTSEPGFVVVEDEDRSFYARSRVSLGIEAPGALTEDDKLLSMMKAAVERHRQSWPDVVSVMLWDSFGNQIGASKVIHYAPDGCGWTGDDCTGDIWTPIYEVEVPSELADWGRPTKDEIESGKELACRNDLQCWGEKHLANVEVTCVPLIERQARYDVEWDDGWFSMKLERWRWNDRAAGSLSYTGDRVKFQNGFGAWQRMTYWCHYDHQAQTVHAEVYGR